jgi:hypothetical protein
MTARYPLVLNGTAIQEVQPGDTLDANALPTVPTTLGGTGNGFTKFTGPTTSEKTFTLPNSSQTLLYAGGALGTPASGTVTNLTGTASININGTVGATTPTTGKFTTTELTAANNSANGSGQIYINGATGNRIDFAGAGLAAPSYTTRSVGTKVCFWPVVGAAYVDYAIGIDSNVLWNSVPSAIDSFKWYAGTTVAATLTGTGNFTAIGNVAGNDLTASGSVGIGAVTPSTYDLTFGGQTTRFIASERQTTSNTAGGALYLTAGSATLGATNKAGGLLVLRSGGSTGSGSSSLFLQTTANVAAATSDNTYLTAFQADNNKIGFYGVAPVVRAAATTAPTANAPAGGTGTAAGGWDTAAHRDTAIAAINNLMTRVQELETIITNLGLSL